LDFGKGVRAGRLGAGLVRTEGGRSALDLIRFSLRRSGPGESGPRLGASSGRP
jgi:hypothetical protein